MTRVVKVALAVSILLTGAACEPDGTPSSNPGHPRCDGRIGAQWVAIEAVGWTLDCRGEFTPPGGELGWANATSTAGGAVPRTVYLWPDRMPDDRVLRAVAWHEAGHVEQRRRGYVAPARTAPVSEVRAWEQWAWWYSICREYVPGVGFGDFYTWPPDGCGGYL